MYYHAFTIKKYVYNKNSEKKILFENTINPKSQKKKTN